MNPCDICEKEVLTEFTVPDVIWSEVTGNSKPDDEYAPGYWCIFCFLSQAEQVLPDQDIDISLHFRREYTENRPEFTNYQS